MSALAFLVRGRSVDVVAMTAIHALRDTLGFGDEVAGLTRDDFVLVEGVDAAAAEAWQRGFTSQQHWFNPNKHRFAALEVAEGGLRCAREGGDWPDPWARRLVDTDRPDLVARRARGEVDDVLGAWIGAEPRAGHYAVPLAVWDREAGIDALPRGAWPDPTRPRLRGVLWTLTLKSEDAARASARTEELAVARARRQGLLLNPHMEGHAAVGPARALDPALG